MLLNWILLSFIVIELICIVISLVSKNRNKTLAFIISLVVVADIIGILFQHCKGVSQARALFVIYYIVHAWMFFGVYLLVRSFSKTKYNFISLGLSAFICLVQTAGMLSNYFGAKTIFLAKRIFLGASWWTAVEADKSYSLLSMRMYMILCLANAFLILVYLGLSYRKTAKIFRTRYIGLLITQVCFLGIELYAHMHQLPVWVNIVFMIPVALIATYFCCFYPIFKLKDHSLTLFSNEMADGFAVYDDKDDLLYANDVIRNAFDIEEQKKFSRRAYMEEWISETVDIEGRDCRLWEKDGKTIYFIIRKTPLIDNGITIGYIYIFHDTSNTIATIRMMEDANAELEHAAKMKADFLANMSHEIRTPMNAVIGMTELALRDNKDTRVADYLYQIRASGRNLLNIINDILDFSKIEAGKLEIIPDKYEPLSEINDVANTLMTRIGEKDIDLFVTTSPNIPHVLYGDSMRIRQILINLANNAIKFTSQGMVHIVVDCEEIDDKNILMKFHVKDTGNGIKEEDLKKLFVSFQQVDSKRNRSVEGTGLGLAISKSLCNAMGGSIGVTSEYGVGSDFFFEIPQTICDDTCELIVENKEQKRAFFIDDESLTKDIFDYNMDILGVSHTALRSFDEYCNQKDYSDYLFFDKRMYGPELEKLLNNNPGCMGVVFTEYGEFFDCNLENIRVLHKPVTTLAFSLILNNRKGSIRKITDDTADIRFTAPDASILIVDDNSINIMVAEGLLEPLKMNIFSANSGKEAIEKLQENKFDIVFMDHMMPEMDGVETTEKIRNEMPDLADMPIIALTANAMTGAKEMFLEHGMNDFVSKPIELKSIVSKIREWLPKEKIIINKETAEEQKTVESIVPHIEGIDSDTAVSALGNEKLYMTILEEYSRTGNKKLEKIQSLYNEENWREYTINVHALKSSSRQIGAMELGDLAEEMEKAGNAEDIETIRDKTDMLLALYGKYLEKISPYFTKAEDELPLIDDFALQESISDLLEACDNLDSLKLGEITDNMKNFSYPDNLADRIKIIFDAVNEFDFDKCSEVCNAILDEIM